MALMALKSLLADSKLELGPEMVEAGLPRYIAQRQQQVQVQGLGLRIRDLGSGCLERLVQAVICLVCLP